MNKQTIDEIKKEFFSNFKSTGRWLNGEERAETVGVLVKIWDFFEPKLSVTPDNKEKLHPLHDKREVVEKTSLHPLDSRYYTGSSGTNATPIFTTNKEEIKTVKMIPDEVREYSDGTREEVYGKGTAVEHTRTLFSAKCNSTHLNFEPSVATVLDQKPSEWIRDHIREYMDILKASDSDYTESILDYLDKCYDERKKK